ncbi:MAG: efflux RND transporter periplasmic adaptor subunit [Candidatus Competibacteraceae bacterium]|nr:efflux RND transporter periplasmic adaptor subunit [Candidatus Competibacteraceae bacterium]MBK8752614.1 efflux RND transporter periplasmic adaptor subunit [Candidatus Competibacteraceae bacterium]
MRRKWIVWAIVALGLLAVGGLAAWRGFGPLAVETVRPTRGSAVRAVYATGTVEPTVMLPIAPRNAGRLMELNVDESAQVHAGQVLARLEDADLKRTVDELEARALFAKSQQDRAQTLLDRGLGTVLERDRARSEWQAVEAAVARARALRSFMTLTAPADGQILQRDGEVGQLIPANQPIFYFSCCAPLRIEAEVDEEDILLVQAGQRVLIRAPALPERILEGQVSEITPKGNPVTRGYRVWIRFTEEPPLRIGMTAEVNIVVSEHPNALLVPTTAVSEGQVWIVREGRVQRRRVQSGLVGESRTEILSGLGETDAVVVHPVAALKDGRWVRGLPEK